MQAIRISEVTFSYTSSRPALSGINLEIESGECVGIIGCNGAGKSTLLKLLVGLLPSFDGEIEIAGLAMCRAHLKEIRSRCGYVFQDAENQLFMQTVYEDVAFGPRNYGCSSTEAEERAMQALRSVQLETLRDRQVYRISGGEKKLVSIATILAMRPEIVLFDEPSVALDPKNRRNLIRILNEMSCTKLIATHDLDLVLDTCSRVILISGGTIAADGDAQTILRDRALLEVHDLELPLSLAGRI